MEHKFKLKSTGNLKKEDETEEQKSNLLGHYSLTDNGSSFYSFGFWKEVLLL